MSKALKKSYIRLVSFNVHSGRNTREIAQVFVRDKNLSKADIILLQEIEFHQVEKICRAESIARHLGFHFVYEPARQLGASATHGLAILSRYPIKKALPIRLPEFRLLFKLQTRIALVAGIKISGINITVCNIHLDTRLNPKQRMRQLNACLTQLKEDYGQNIIIGGDFNTIPFRTAAGGIPIFYSNQAKHLHKNMIDMGFNHFCEPLGFTMTSGFLRMRLDHIYTDRLPIAKCGVEKNIHVSDHKPLWADIEIF
ncbi:MAG: endonuclease/exonuclease/phosphatase family protein [Candidatus Doudnabacteria bacterium]|nr:endonuclease/exonuclease/phosphatase family protein [Candidatus Doudnabacteria bacterium]